MFLVRDADRGNLVFCIREPLTSAETHELNGMRQPSSPAVCPACGRPRTKRARGGLVPVNGGERLGAVRLAALVEVRGAGRVTGPGQ